MKYLQIARQALVIPEHRHWGAQILGAGSIVALSESSMSPLGITEPFVRFVDNIGREAFGWLARSTTLKPARIKVLTHAGYDPGADTSPIDWVRNRVILDRQRDPDSGWTLTTWVSSLGEQHLNELRNAIRELGGSVPSGAHANTIISRALRLISHGEVTMTDEAVQETKADTKRAAKTTKRAATKKAVVAATGGRSMARTAGNTIVPLLTKAGTKKGLSIAKALQAGKDVGKRQLQELRDAINETASAARESKKDSLASALSSSNRIVRRLARGA